MSTYTVKGQRTIEVDEAYFYTIMADSHLYEYLVYCGVEDWEGHEEATKMLEEEGPIDSHLEWGTSNDRNCV